MGGRTTSKAGGCVRIAVTKPGSGGAYHTGGRFHIPDLSLISGSPSDKASTRSRGPVTRVTCQGNQDSLRLVPARAVACRVLYI